MIKGESVGWEKTSKMDNVGAKTSCNTLSCKVPAAGILEVGIIGDDIK